MSQRIDLGFLESIESWKLQSQFFPSKVGGKPAWLDLSNIPSPEQLQCTTCEKQMIFFMQVYAPHEDRADTFHRTIFVFLCKNVECHKKNDNSGFLILRNQLPRDNKYYSSEPPVENEQNILDITPFANLCHVCGCLGPKKCASCKSVSYCSREHQLIDWKSGHKRICANKTSSLTIQLLYPEYEIEMEEEVINEENNLEEIEKREMDVYKKLVSEGRAGTMAEVDDEELSQHIIKNDTTFIKFKKRIDHYPEQILRYQRGGTPLLVSDENTDLLANIPPCEYCSGPRQFEFQILPQILFQLKEESVDFGSLIIYTCKSSCSKVDVYQKEFVIKQDISDS